MSRRIQMSTWGASGISHTTRYYYCKWCDIRFSTTGPVVKILTDGPAVIFKTRTEAIRVLYTAVADEKAWFGELSEETVETARVVFRHWLFKEKTKRPARYHKNSMYFGRGKRKAKTA